MRLNFKQLSWSILFFWFELILCAPGRNRTNNYPLGRDCYIHLTTGAMMGTISYCLGLKYILFCNIIFRMSLDVNIEHRLEDIEEKIDKNSKILRSIKRKQSFDFWFGIVKILIFVGLFYYAYQFAEPVLEQAKEAYINFQGLTESVDSFKSSNIFDILKKQQ